MSSLRYAVRTRQNKYAVLEALDKAQFPYLVEIKPLTPPKTLSQIKYAHSLCGSLAEHHKVSLDKAKRDAKAEFGIVEIATSILTGDRSARLKSFAEYSKDELTAFITAMEMHLDTNHIDYIKPKEAVE